MTTSANHQDGSKARELERELETIVRGMHDMANFAALIEEERLEHAQRLYDEIHHEPTWDELVQEAQARGVEAPGQETELNRMCLVAKIRDPNLNGS